jgi:hypothetical protein
MVNVRGASRLRAGEIHGVGGAYSSSDSFRMGLCVLRTFRFSAVSDRFSLLTKSLVINNYRILSDSREPSETGRKGQVSGQ